MTNQSIPRGQILSAQASARSIPAVLQAVALFSIIAGLFAALISATPGFVGNDDYYHARMGSEIIDQRRLAIDFPWLPQTILSPVKFVDHHLLYHIYIAPWAHFGGLNGAKIGQVAIAAGAFLAIWILLRQIGVRYPALWSLALFGLSAPFLYRMLMIRTQGASLLVLILALIVLFQRRYAWMVLLSFAYVWLYNGFILLPVVAVMYVISTWVADWRLDFRPVTYALLGTTLGIVINPYFPQNVMFLVEHLGAKIDFESGARVGSEWYPYTTGALLANSSGALLMLIVGLLRPSFTRVRRDRVETMLLFMALFTLFMLFRSRRFIEYYPPFALLFCAAAWGRSQAFPFKSRHIVRVASFSAIAVASILVTSTLSEARRLIENTDDHRQFVGASNWLKANTSVGTPVFQLDWDDFTRLFYFNTRNTYLIGLDPTYLERADQQLWDLWVHVTRGEVEQPSGIIKDHFGARYVVGDRQHEAFEAQAANDPAMVLVYWDANSIIWRIEE